MKYKELSIAFSEIMNTVILGCLNIGYRCEYSVKLYLFTNVTWLLMYNCTVLFTNHQLLHVKLLIHKIWWYSPSSSNIPTGSKMFEA